jgi:hypothetical protein
MNGDGYPDMALGYFLWKGREDIVQSVMANRMDINVRFHFGGPRGFSQTADCQADLSLGFDQGNLFNAAFLTSLGHMWESISLEGDFNGDGRRDLLFADGEDHASVRLFHGRAEGFSKQADLTFPASLPWNTLLVRDLNGDGISDLVFDPKLDGGKRVVYLSERR